MFLLNVFVVEELPIDVSGPFTTSHNHYICTEYDISMHCLGLFIASYIVCLHVRGKSFIITTIYAVEYEHMLLSTILCKGTAKSSFVY